MAAPGRIKVALIDSSLIIMCLFFSRRLGTERGVLQNGPGHQAYAHDVMQISHVYLAPLWRLLFLPSAPLPEGSGTAPKSSCNVRMLHFSEAQSLLSFSCWFFSFHVQKHKCIRFSRHVDRWRVGVTRSYVHRGKELLLINDESSLSEDT